MLSGPRAPPSSESGRSDSWVPADFSFGPLFNACQLMMPEALEGPRPLMEWADRLDVGAIEDLASLAPHVHQPHVAKYLEVLRDGGLPQAQRRDDVGDRPLARREVDEDVTAVKFGDRVEDVRGGGCARHGQYCIPIWEYVNVKATVRLDVFSNCFISSLTQSPQEKGSEITRFSAPA
jgi:hypothetical protein